MSIVVAVASPDKVSGLLLWSALKDDSLLYFDHFAVWVGVLTLRHLFTAMWVGGGRLTVSLLRNVVWKTIMVRENFQMRISSNLSYKSIRIFSIV